ncbi:MAG: cadherin-like beta sandwich domain-containing protein [Saccharofermentanales bacterium]
MKKTRIRTGAEKILSLAAGIFLAASLLFPAAAGAEGVSADMTMTLGRSVLNIGKTFSVTVAVKPNANISITSFDFVLGFDSAKLEIIKTDGLPKTGRPSNVPSTFEYESNVSGSSIVVIGTDGTASQNAPIKASASTPIIIFYFKVKDSAAAGSTVNFTITEPTVNQLIAGEDPVAISLTIKSPKTGTIGARLDTNTYLSTLTSDIGTLSPEFTKATTEYTLDVPEDCDSVQLTAAADSAKSSFKVTGGEGLDYGPNTATIKVTAEDPDYVRIYTITINRANPPDPTATATPEPTAAITSEPEISSEASSSSSSPSASAESEDEPLVPVDNGLWKNLTILFASLFLVTAGTSLWLAIDKVRNRDKIIKVRRV